MVEQQGWQALSNTLITSKGTTTSVAHNMRVRVHGTVAVRLTACRDEQKGHV